MTTEEMKEKEITVDTTAEMTQVIPRRMTKEVMQREYDFTLAQMLTKKLLVAGKITKEEFEKITALNVKTFRPWLAELMG